MTKEQRAEQIIFEMFKQQEQSNWGLIDRLLTELKGLIGDNDG